MSDPEITTIINEAEAGDAEAQCELGVMYSEGQSVPQDDIKAAHWYCMAAEQGDADAQLLLAMIYDEGQGVPQDDALAMYWYHKASEQGVDVAQEASNRLHKQVHWNSKASLQGPDDPEAFENKQKAGRITQKTGAKISRIKQERDGLDKSLEQFRKLDDIELQSGVGSSFAQQSHELIQGLYQQVVKPGRNLLETVNANSGNIKEKISEDLEAVLAEIGKTHSELQNYLDKAQSHIELQGIKVTSVHKRGTFKPVENSNPKAAADWNVVEARDLVQVITDKKAPSRVECFNFGFWLSIGVWIVSGLVLQASDVGLVIGIAAGLIIIALKLNERSQLVSDFRLLSQSVNLAKYYLCKWREESQALYQQSNSNTEAETKSELLDFRQKFESYIRHSAPLNLLGFYSPPLAA